VKLLLDANVLLDVLAKREPWYDHSATVLSLAESDEIEGFLSAHSVSTLFYLLARHLGSQEATSALVELLRLLSVAPLDHDTVLRGLALGWSDFEDALQMLCGIGVDADYLVTRNPGDFKGASLPVVTPSELLALMSSDRDRA
jgi:predicted nucleic acid-binding protein